ncbi:uncharacterized protein ACDP82_017949 isoform 1-T3 [Pangshura tecta]
MLQHLCNKSSPVVEQEKEIYAFCSANDLERANRSYQQLLLLHDVSSWERSVKEKSGLCFSQTFHQLYAQYPTVPDAPESFSLKSEEDETSCPEPSMSQDPHYLPSSSSSEPDLMTQGELNDFVRDLELPKSKAELLGSRLQQWNLLAAALQAVHACPQASDVLLHQLKR